MSKRSASKANATSSGGDQKLPFIRSVHVDLTSRPGTFRNIEDAIASIPQGYRSEIIVAGGTYECPTTILGMHDMDLEIRGEVDSMPVFISNETTLHTSLNPEASLVFQNIRFESRNPLYPAVLVTSGTPMFQKCRIQSLQIDLNGAPVLDHCRIENSPSCGVSLTGTGSAEIRNCEFRGALLYHLLIHCVAPASLETRKSETTITSCQFHESGQGAIVIMGRQCSPSISRCVIEDTALVSTETPPAATTTTTTTATGTTKGKSKSDATASDFNEQQQARASIAAFGATLAPGSDVDRAAIVIVQGATPTLEENTCFGGVGCGLAVYGPDFEPFKVVSVEVAAAKVAAQAAAASNTSNRTSKLRSGAAKTNAAQSNNINSNATASASSDGEPGSRSSGDRLPDTWKLGSPSTVTTLDANHSRLRKNVFRDNAKYGVLVAGPSSRLAIADTDVERNAMGGCVAKNGGQCHAFHCRVTEHRNNSIALLSTGRYSLIRLTDVHITQSSVGISVQEGGWVVADDDGGVGSNNSVVLDDCGVGVSLETNGVFDADEGKATRCSVGVQATSFGRGSWRKGTLESNGVGYRSSDGGHMAFHGCALRRNGISVDGQAGGRGLLQACVVTDSTGSCQVSLGPAADVQFMHTEVRSASCVAVACKEKCRSSFFKCVFGGHKWQEVIRFERWCDPLFEECTFSGGSDGCSLVFHEDSGGTVINCEVSKALRSGIVVKSLADPQLRGNVIAENGIGVELLPGSRAHLDKNIIRDNAQCNIQSIGYSQNALTAAAASPLTNAMKTALQASSTLSKNVVSASECGVRATTGSTLHLSRNLFRELRIAVDAADETNIMCVGNDFLRNRIGVAVRGASCRGTFIGNTFRESRAVGMWVASGVAPLVMDNIFAGHFPRTTNTAADADDSTRRVIPIPLFLDARCSGRFSGNRFVFNTLGLVAHPSARCVLLENYFQGNGCGMVCKDISSSGGTTHSSIMGGRSSSSFPSPSSTKLSTFSPTSSGTPTTNTVALSSPTYLVDVLHDFCTADPFDLPEVVQEHIQLYVNVDDIGGPLMLANTFLQNDIGLSVSTRCRMKRTSSDDDGGNDNAPSSPLSSKKSASSQKHGVGSAASPQVGGGGGGGDKPLQMDACIFMNSSYCSLRTAHSGSLIRGSLCLFHDDGTTVKVEQKEVEKKQQQRHHVIMYGEEGTDAWRSLGGRVTLDTRSSSNDDDDESPHVAAGRHRGGNNSLLDGCIFFGRDALVSSQQRSSHMQLFACVFVASTLHASSCSAPDVVRCSFEGYPALIHKLFDCRNQESIEYVTDPRTMSWCQKNSGFTFSSRIPVTDASFVGRVAVHLEDGAACRLLQCHVRFYERGIFLNSNAIHIDIHRCCIERCREAGVFIDDVGFFGTFASSVVMQNFGAGIRIRGPTMAIAPSPDHDGDHDPASPQYSSSSHFSGSSPAASAHSHHHDFIETTASSAGIITKPQFHAKGKIVDVYVVEHRSRLLLPSVDTAENETLIADLTKAFDAALLLDVRQDEPFNGSEENPRHVQLSEDDDQPSKRDVSARYTYPIATQGSGVGIWVDASASSSGAGSDSDRHKGGDAGGNVELLHCVIVSSHITNVLLSSSSSQALDRPSPTTRQSAASRLNALLVECVIRDSSGYGVVVRQATSATILNTKILRNAYAGVLAEPSSTPHIDGSLFESNRVGYVGCGDSGTIAKTAFTLQEISAVRARSSSTLTLTDCQFEDNNSGVEINGAAVHVVRCMFMENTYYGVVVSSHVASAAASTTATASAASSPKTRDDHGGHIASPTNRNNNKKKKKTNNNDDDDAPTQTLIRQCVFRRNSGGGIVLRNAAMSTVQENLFHSNNTAIIVRTSSIITCSDCTVEDNLTGAVFEWSAQGVITDCLFKRNHEKSILSRTGANVHVLRNIFLHEAPVAVLMEGRGTFVQNTFRKPQTNCFIVAQGGNPVISYSRFLLLHGSASDIHHAQELEERDVDKLKDIDREFAIAEQLGILNPIELRTAHNKATDEQLKQFVMPLDEAAQKEGGGGGAGLSRGASFATAKQSGGNSEQPSHRTSRVPSRRGSATATRPASPSTFTVPETKEGGDDVVDLTTLDVVEDKKFGRVHSVRIVGNNVDAVTRRKSVAIHRPEGEGGIIRRKSYVMGTGSLIKGDVDTSSEAAEAFFAQKRKHTALLDMPPIGSVVFDAAAASDGDEDDNNSTVEKKQAASPALPPKKLSLGALQRRRSSDARAAGVGGGGLERRVSSHRIDTFQDAQGYSVHRRPRNQLEKDLVQAEKGETPADADDDIADNLRVAISIEAGGLALVSRCVFAHNQPCSILCDGPSANPTIENCMFYDHRVCAVVVTGGAAATIRACLFVRNTNAIQMFHAKGKKLVVEDCSFRLNMSSLEAVEGNCGLVTRCRFLQDETSILCSSGGVLHVTESQFLACDDCVMGEPNSQLSLEQVDITGCRDAVTLQSDEPLQVNPIGHFDAMSGEHLTRVTITCCLNGIRSGTRRDTQIVSCKIQACAQTGIEISAPDSDSALANVPCSLSVNKIDIDSCRSGIVVSGDGCNPFLRDVHLSFCGTGFRGTSGSQGNLESVTIHNCLSGVVLEQGSGGTYRQLEVVGCEAGLSVSCGDEDTPLIQGATIYDCNVVGAYFQKGAGGQFIEGTIFECGVGVMFCEQAYTYLASTMISHPSNNTVTKKNDAMRIARFAGPRLGAGIEVMYSGSPAVNSRTARMRRLDREKEQEDHDAALLAVTSSWGVKQANVVDEMEKLMLPFDMHSGRMNSLPHMEEEEQHHTTTTATVTSSASEQNIKLNSTSHSASAVTTGDVDVKKSKKKSHPRRKTSQNNAAAANPEESASSPSSSSPHTTATSAAATTTINPQQHSPSHHHHHHDHHLNNVNSVIICGDEPIDEIVPITLPPLVTSFMIDHSSRMSRLMKTAYPTAMKQFVTCRNPTSLDPNNNNATGSAADAAAGAAASPLSPWSPHDADSSPSDIPFVEVAALSLERLLKERVTRSLEELEAMVRDALPFDPDKPRPPLPLHYPAEESSRPDRSMREDSISVSVGDSMFTLVDVVEGASTCVVRILPPIDEDTFKQPNPYPFRISHARARATVPITLEDLKRGAKKPTVPSATVLQLTRRPQPSRFAVSAAMMDVAAAIAKKHNTLFADQILTVFHALDHRRCEQLTFDDLLDFLLSVVDQCEPPPPVCELPPLDGKPGKKRSSSSSGSSSRKPRKPSSTNNNNNSTGRNVRKEVEGPSSAAAMSRSSNRNPSLIPNVVVTTTSGDEPAAGVPSSRTAENAELLRVVDAARRKSMKANETVWHLVEGITATDEDIGKAWMSDLIIDDTQLLSRSSMMSTSMLSVTSLSSSTNDGGNTRDAASSGDAESLRVVPETEMTDSQLQAATNRVVLSKFVQRHFESLGKVPERDGLVLAEFESLMSSTIEGALGVYLKLYFPWMWMPQPAEDAEPDDGTRDAGRKKLGGARGFFTGVAKMTKLAQGAR